MLKKLFLSLLFVSQIYTYQYKPKDFTYLIERMPRINKTLLEQHFRLYQGYVWQVNFLNSLLIKKGADPFIFFSIKRQLGFEFDGMRLHELYFENLGGNGRIREISALKRALVAQFGSYRAWQEDFRKTCQTRGVGWAILYMDEDTGMLYNAWVADHSMGVLVRGSPILVIDLWEHAYMTQFGLDRAKYIEIILDYVDFQILDMRFSCSAQK
jgi:superoxide dismutase, Fe-Mn family